MLSNGGTKRGLPISCFLNEATDSPRRHRRACGTRMSGSRAKAAASAATGAIFAPSAKKSARTARPVGRHPVHPGHGQRSRWRSARARCAADRPRSICRCAHPEIEEFVEIRRPTGGDPNRKAPNLHHGILVSDDFMRAVENWTTSGRLRSPKDNSHRTQNLGPLALDSHSDRTRRDRRTVSRLLGPRE